MLALYTADRPAYRLDFDGINSNLISFGESHCGRRFAEKTTIDYV
jgi:hypothetical protein